MKKPTRIFLWIGLSLSTLLVTGLLGSLLYALFFVYGFPTHNPSDGLSVLQYNIDVLIGLVIFNVCCLIGSFLKIGILRKLRGAVLAAIILDVTLTVIFFLALYISLSDNVWSPDLSLYVAIQAMASIGFGLAATFSALGYSNIVKEIKAHENDKNPQRLSSFTKSIHRPLIFWGEVIVTAAFGISTVFAFVEMIRDLSYGSGIYFNILRLVVFIVATVISAMGIRISVASHAYYRFSKGYILVSFVLSGLAALLYLFATIQAFRYLALNMQTPFLLIAFLSSAVLIFLGFLSAQKEPEPIQEEIVPTVTTPEKRVKRTLMFIGEIIATVTFVFLAGYDFYLSIFVQRSLDSMLMFLLLVFIASTVLSAMGIGISLSGPTYYHNRRGFVLASVIMCCIIGTGFLVFELLYSPIMLLLWPVLLACFFIILSFAAAIFLILKDYVKNNTPALGLVTTANTLSDIASSIAKFDELRKSGAITQEEFDAVKAKQLENIK